MSPADEALLMLAEWQRDAICRCAARLSAQQLGLAFVNLPETMSGVPACKAV